MSCINAGFHGGFIRCSGFRVATAFVAGIVAGHVLRKLHEKYMTSGLKRPKRWKSYESADPLLQYTVDHSIRLQPIQKRLMEETMTHPMKAMMGAPEILQFLQNYIRANNCKKVIEIGVYTGFSTLGFALALPPNGKIVACDVSEEYMNIGKKYWKEAMVEKKIDVYIQPAIKTLDELLAKGEAGSYDLVFIDADKQSYDDYFEKSLQLLRRGGLIAIDNVLWSGSVLDEKPTRPGAAPIKALNEKLKIDPRIDISMFVVGDGLTLAFKL